MSVLVPQVIKQTIGFWRGKEQDMCQITTVSGGECTVCKNKIDMLARFRQSFALHVNSHGRDEDENVSRVCLH